MWIQSEQGEEKEKMKELERQRQLAIMDKLNKKQLERYEHFRRAGFKKAAMNTPSVVNMKLPEA